jgi:hypothetical protein
MIKGKLWVHFCAMSCLRAVLLLAVAQVACAQAAPDFSGVWNQENDRCQPKCNGDVTLRIEHHDPALIVETATSQEQQTSRRAVQKYTTDGKVSVSTGVDGDEFHTAVIWKDSILVFSIEEHEDGRILRSTEMWLLIENGATLQRTRVRSNGEKQILFYQRRQRVSE